MRCHSRGEREKRPRLGWHPDCLAGVSPPLLACQMVPADTPALAERLGQGKKLCQARRQFCTSLRSGTVHASASKAASHLHVSLVCLEAILNFI